MTTEKRVCTWGMLLEAFARRKLTKNINTIHKLIFDFQYGERNQLVNGKKLICHPDSFPPNSVYPRPYSMLGPSKGLFDDIGDTSADDIAIALVKFNRLDKPLPAAYLHEGDEVLVDNSFGECPLVSGKIFSFFDAGTHFIARVILNAKSRNWAISSYADAYFRPAPGWVYRFNRANIKHHLINRDEWITTYPFATGLIRQLLRGYKSDTGCGVDVVRFVEHLEKNGAVVRNSYSGDITDINQKRLRRHRKKALFSSIISKRQAMVLMANKGNM